MKKEHERVEIELALPGESYFLVPTLGAMRKIDRQFGDISTAIERVAKLNFAAIVAVAKIGADVRDEAATKKLEQRLYERGVGSAAAPLVEYLGVLANGGRRMDETAPGSDEDNDEGNG
jgi:hypothetical protein